MAALLNGNGHVGAHRFDSRHRDIEAGNGGRQGNGDRQRGGLRTGPWAEDHLRVRPRDRSTSGGAGRDEPGDQDQPVGAEIGRVRRQDIDRKAKFAQPAIDLENQAEVVAPNALRLDRPCPGGA
jgi:hypothetical protein